MKLESLISDAPTILVVDDSDSVRVLLRRILEKEGCRVLEARDGEEAIALFCQHDPDVLMTDMVMPGKSGKDVMKEVRKQDPDMKMVHMSGYDFYSLPAELDGSLFLQKPFRREDVLKVLATLLRQ